MPTFRVIVVEHAKDRTTTMVVPLERVPDPGSTVELPHGEQVVVRDVLGAGSYGTAGTLITAPAWQ